LPELLVIQVLMVLQLERMAHQERMVIPSLTVWLWPMVSLALQAPMVPRMVPLAVTAAMVATELLDWTEMTEPELGQTMESPVVMVVLVPQVLQVKMVKQACLVKPVELAPTARLEMTAKPAMLVALAKMEASVTPA